MDQARGLYNRRGERGLLRWRLSVGLLPVRAGFGCVEEEQQVRDDGRGDRGPGADPEAQRRGCGVDPTGEVACLSQP